MKFTGWPLLLFSAKKGQTITWHLLGRIESTGTTKSGTNRYNQNQQPSNTSLTSIHQTLTCQTKPKSLWLRQLLQIIGIPSTTHYESQNFRPSHTNYTYTTDQVLKTENGRDWMTEEKKTSVGLSGKLQFCFFCLKKREKWEKVRKSRREHQKHRIVKLGPFLESIETQIICEMLFPAWSSRQKHQKVQVKY